MKKTLLATTALVGASLLAAPANATVGSRDNMNVTLGGMFWFSAYVKDEEISANNGRGYGFTVSESEIHVAASAKADNGITYGVRLEINGGAADNSNMDEAVAFLDSPSWGRIEMGDEDDVTNRMQQGSWQAARGAGGPLGGLGDLNTVFNGVGGNGGVFIARADWQTFTTSDDTKVNYFSPRFSGLQLGASWTPDTGEVSGGPATADSDADGDYENVLSVAATYTGSVNGVNVGASFGWQTGSDEAAGGAETQDLDIWGVGARVGMNGFTLGAAYRDIGDTGLTAAQSAAGADAGSMWSVGLGWSSGPWGLSGWYHNGSMDNTNAAARETEITRYGLGAGYRVAPGWDLRAELTFLEHANVRTGVAVGGTTDNDGKGFLLVNRFLF